MSPIAKRLERTGPSDLATSFRRLGRFWWIWILFGQWGAATLGGHHLWPAELLRLALGVWGIAALADLAAALPAPWSGQLRNLVGLAVALLVAEPAVTYLVDGRTVAESIGTIGSIIVFAGYVVVLGGFSSSLPGAGEIQATWRRALRWIEAMVVGVAFAAAFAGIAHLAHQTHGTTVWSIGIGIGLVLGFVSEVASLLVTARATMLTRHSVEPPAA